MKIVVNVNGSLFNYEYISSDIVFNSKGDAVQALVYMYKLISEFGVVRVSDLYDMMGMDTDYADYRHGWSNIDSARIEEVKNGYIIRMPKALLLD